MEDILTAQREICLKYQSDFLPTRNDEKLGISLNVKDHILPINGLRIPPEGDTNGWYIWAGEELSQDPDFFVPLHVEHLDDWSPNIKKYLGLAPGWRFLIAGDYEDIWFDPAIVEDL